MVVVDWITVLEDFIDKVEDSFSLVVEDSVIFDSVIEVFSVLVVSFDVNEIETVDVVNVVAVATVLEVSVVWTIGEELCKVVFCWTFVELEIVGFSEDVNGVDELSRLVCFFVDIFEGKVEFLESITVEVEEDNDNVRLDDCVVSREMEVVCSISLLVV